MPLPLHLHTSTVQERRPASTVPSPSQPHHVIAPSRLRNLFTPNKSATFAVTVTIHSIQNVPQVHGSFSVGWKFRDGEGRGKSKVDVKAASLQNDVTATPPARNPLAFSRNRARKRQSFEIAESHTGSAASSTTTVDDPNGGHGVPFSPISPDSISSFSTEPSTQPSRDTSLSGASLPSQRPSKRSTDSVGTRSELSSLSFPGSSATSVTSSRRTSDTSTEVPLTYLSGKRDDDEDEESTVHGGPSNAPEHTKAVAAPSHLTVPIQHSRATRRQANLLHKASNASLRASADQAASGSHAASSLLVDSISVPANTISGRQGCTPIAQLNNHSCEWGCTVTQLVRIKIHPLPLHHHHTRTTRPPLPDTPPLGILGAGAHSESGLKLKVWQHIRPPTSDETHSVERGSMKHRANGRSEDSYEFGGISLDLAEFVGEEIRRATVTGAVTAAATAVAAPAVLPAVDTALGMGGITRRYLLTEKAKTNATLKLTIDIKQVSGETNFVAPVLQKRHIVAGLADLTSDDPLIEPHHLQSLHLTRSNVSSTSDFSSRSNTSRAPSISNLRLTSTTSGSSSPVVLDRSVPSPMTRLKKPPEEHLLKPPAEATKSSSAAASKARTLLGKRRETAAREKEENHFGRDGLDSLYGKSGRGGFDTSTAAREGVETEDDATAGNRRNGRHHHHQRDKKSHRHQHHPHHSADLDGTPERLAEAVFNPTPSNVWTPFTYVPDALQQQPQQQPKTDRSPKKGKSSTPEKRPDLGVRQMTTATATDIATDTEEGSDVTAHPRREFHDKTSQDLQPHAREGARWNAAEGAWQRRRGRGYGKMRMGTVRRPVGEIAHPFFKRLGATSGGVPGGQGEHREMVV